MDRLENDLLSLVVIIHMLKNQQHKLSNILAGAKEIRHDDHIEQLTLQLDAVEAMINQKEQELTYLAAFIIRPINK